MLPTVGRLLVGDPYGLCVAQYRGGPGPEAEEPVRVSGRLRAALGVVVGRCGGEGKQDPWPCCPSPDPVGRGWSAGGGTCGTCVLPYLRIHLLIDRCFVEGIREGDDDRVDSRPVGEEVVSHRVVGVLVVCNRLRNGCLEVL